MGKGTFVLATGLLCVACSSTPDRGRLNLDLIEASRRGDEGQVSRLLTQGADINATDPEGWTPYLAASVEGHWKVMKILQQKGCKTDPGF